MGGYGYAHDLVGGYSTSEDKIIYIVNHLLSYITAIFITHCTTPNCAMITVNLDMRLESLQSEQKGNKPRGHQSVAIYVQEIWKVGGYGWVTSAHAAIQNATPAQTYWRTMLPQTPIPSSIQEVLRQAKEMNSFEMERAPTVFISYKCAASDNQIHNDPNVPLFFLKKSLKSGTKKTLDLTKIISTPPFLSVERAQATPFSSSKLMEILNIFKIERDSAEAVAIQRTLAECEELPLDGERKRCVTSMEAMVEFIKAELSSSDVHVVETTVTGGADQGVPRQEYVVGIKGAHRVGAEALASCHPEPYPRAVYYCHTTSNVEVYKVHLVGANGVAVEAVATCHTNTSTWDPNYMGFKMLKVKPGTEPICHFLPLGHLIFAGLSKEDSFAL
ncbi:hypothetical protein M5K25_003628 [Dendrobium thyrsiflorum]|uniref:BURP domain-containing protein n=1 Tax=Dendrobium thyrsiflorum TaxID=117978 RepID=A0ABD0VJH6_DENTH